MQITDEGILISKSSYGETSLILSVFTENHGIQKGLLKGGATNKYQAILQLGNVLYIQKRYKLEENLGTLKVELQDSYLGDFFNNSIKINILYSLCGLIDSLILEKEKHQELYTTTKAFIKFIALSNNKIEILQKYIQWEIILLKELGFGLDLSKCVVTNKKDDIYYLSPRTGKAVNKEVGEEYKDKLFIIPKFLKSDNNKSNTVASEECKKIMINQGFKITNYFFSKLAKEYNINVSSLRIIILNKALTKS